MKTVTIYARVSPETAEYLFAQARRARMPMAAALDVLLKRAQAEGWHLPDAEVATGER